MTRNRFQGSIVANPVLVGAVTVLVVIVAVVLAYNANKGLPFVPTYDVKAQLPGGLNLVQSNEVRIGGFRVGQIDKIEPSVDPKTRKSIAIIHMKLDKEVEPLPADTSVLIRPRSALGLKYASLTLGKSKRTLKAGETLPLSNATKPVEVDDFFSTFDEETRLNQRTALEGYGTAFSGRGGSINIVIENLVPFVTHLEPVMRNLSDPRTRLNQFFRNAGRVSAEIAPVAETYADLFGNMATTFEALGRDPEALRQTIERAGPTLDAGIRSFPVQRPFLADAERLFTNLEPVAREFEASLPAVADALEVGTPVQRKAPQLTKRTREVFRALIDLTENPNTLLALKDLTQTLRVGRPLVRYVAPYHTVCNYWNYYWTEIGEHVSEPVPGGTTQRVLAKSDSANPQDNKVGNIEADRPVDIAANKDVDTAQAESGDDLQSLHRQYPVPAIDAQGNADCQVGQGGYISRLISGPPRPEGGRYAPSNEVPAVGADKFGGGSHVVVDGNTPGLSGPTHVGRKLKIDNLKDVP